MSRHQHEWAEIRRTTVPGRRGEWEIKGSDRETFQMLAFGFVAVELRCVGCGDISERRILGATA